MSLSRSSLCAEKLADQIDATYERGREEGWKVRHKAPWATGKDIKALGKQTRIILDALSCGEWLDVLELERVSGSRRVGARMNDLRNAGYSWESRRKGKTRLWEYRMMSTQGSLL